MTICNACGLEYAQNHPNQKYCQPCKPLAKAAYNRKRNLDISRQKAERRAAKVCPSCGTMFIPKKTMAQQYCSKQCQLAQTVKVDDFNPALQAFCAGAGA